jgi:hypothetical protein
LKPIGTECRTCHEDRHLGQLDGNCSRCHSPDTFKVAEYEHANLTPRFRGLHLRLPCLGCHKTETGQFPAGPGTAVRFKIAATCVTCHPQLSGATTTAARREPAHSVSRTLR